MRWREAITGLYASSPRRPGIETKAKFFPPASVANMADANAVLNASLPASLRSLLLETNGVMEMMAIDEGEWFESMWLLWTIEEIIAQNRFYRAANRNGTYTRDLSSLVFFASAGTDGILFGFTVEDEVCAPGIMVWHPMMDELDKLSPSLEGFLRGWLTGAISV